jgi:uncharacterized membrane protein YbhN (UPF0104 family)
MYGDRLCQTAFTYKFSISVGGAGRSINSLRALIAYRGIYYLLPLGVATAMLGIQEVLHGNEKARHF